MINETTTWGARPIRQLSAPLRTFLLAGLLALAPAAWGSQLNLSWVDNSTNETGFSIERALADQVFSPIASVGANVITYSDSTVTSGTQYYYRVRAFNANGYSDYSNVCVAQVATPLLNTAPTIGDVGNQSVTEDTATGVLAFTVGDAETAAGSLSVTATSSNLTLLPTANVVLGGSGANRTVTLTPAANQSGTATVTLTVSDGTATASDTFILTVLAVNDRPTISAVANQVVVKNSPTGALAFSVSDVETAAGSLTVTAASSNSTLVPGANIVLGGSGANRTVTVTPAANQVGTATITLTVSDGSATATSSFTLTCTDSSSAGLVAAYSFNEGTGSTVTDASGNGNTGTISGATWTTAGKYGSALSFNGTSSLIAIPASASLNITSAITLEAWTYPTVSQSGWRTILQKESEAFWLHASSTAGALRPGAGGTFNGSTSTFYAPSAIAVTTWTHLAMTYDGATARLYVNGAQVSSMSVSGALQSTTTPLRIGGNVPYGEFFQGLIDEVRVYNRALSAAEIQTDMGVAVGGVIANSAPTISSVANQTLVSNSATSALAFTVGDAETAAASLTVAGSSSNSSLVPAANIVFGGSGSSRTVTVTPAANQTGTTTITLTVSDGTASTSTTFTLTVSAPINTAPTITTVANQTITAGSATAALSFTVADAETAAGGLLVSATSSNLTLLPTANIVLGGSGSARTVTLTPAAGQTGTATVTLTVSDGVLTASSSFALTVNPAVNSAPTISAIGAQVINEDTATGQIAFTVSDTQTSASALLVSGSSSNTALVPASGITFGGSDANRTVVVTPAANQSGTTTISVTVSDGSLTASSSFVVTVAAVNDAPFITAIADQSIQEDGATGALAFTVGDIETAATSLSVTATSSNQTLVPNAGIVLGGSGANRTVAINPAANQSGSAVISVAVSDGSLSTVSSFVVTVLPVNDAPVISSIADQSINQGGTTGALAFTIGDTETSAANLTVSATSSNQTLVPTANLILSGSGSSRTVTVNPVAGQSGSATVTVTVSDGLLSASTTFVVNVAATNTAPVISAIADQAVTMNTATAALAFTVSDSATPAASLTVSGSSSNLTLVPTGNIVFGGSGSNRTVTVTPAANLIGTAKITVVVSDGSLTTSESFVLTVSAPPPTTKTFTNSSYITIATSGKASPYPTAIAVSGTTGTIDTVTVKLSGLTHSNVADVDILLVSPTGQKVVIMSDAGSSSASNATLTFADAASASLPKSGQVVTGTFKPTNYGTTADTFSSPAPAGPYGSALSAFAGQSANGTWALYVMDDQSSNKGKIASGWSLTITTHVDAVVATDTTSTSGQTSMLSVESETMTAATEGLRTFTSGTTTVTSSIDAGRLGSYATKAAVDVATPLVSRFVVSGTGSRSVLVRAVGPTLANLGLSGALAQPVLRIYDSSGQKLLEQRNWDDTGALAAVFTRLGAFPLVTGSADAATVIDLVPGSYSAEISDGGGSGGVALLEIYDAGDATTAPAVHLTGFGTDGLVNTAGSTITSAVTISGTTTRRLLVRGVGPGLAQTGVVGLFANPQLAIYDSSNRLLARNDDWERPLTVDASQPGASAAELVDAAVSTGLPALASGSTDAAVIVTLAPGVYSFQVSGSSSTARKAALEIRELP